MTRTRRARASGLLLLSLISIHLSHSQTVTYSFEPPQLTFGQTTPFLNLVPDMGPASFLASFTVPTGGSFSVNSIIIHPAFSGQDLLDPSPPGGAGDTLRIIVNTPITDVQVDFELMTFSGHLQLQSSAGITNADAVASTQYGSLVFHAATGFTQFDLLGFTSENTSTLLAIDNLSMTIIPEPSTFSLLVASISMFLLNFSRRFQKSPRIGARKTIFQAAEPLG